MYRYCLILIGALVLTMNQGPGVVRGQDKKDEPKEFGKTITEWLEILRKGENPKDRKRALIALEYSAKAGTVGLPAIIECVEKDKDKEIRAHAVALLARLGPEKKGVMLAVVTALKKDPEGQVREAAATALGGKLLGQAPQYMNELTAKLKDPHAGTRVAVVSTLRNLDDKAAPAVPALLESAQDPKENALVRAGAILIISRFGKDNSRSIPVLVEIVNQTESPTPIREAAVEGLGRLGADSSEAIAVLSKSLVEKTVEMRKASAAALLKLGAKAQPAWDAVKTRFNKVNEPDNVVRNSVIHLAGALGKTNDEAITLLIVAAEKEESNENRIAAIQELGELGARAKSALETLQKIQRDDARLAIREAAEKAAAQIKSAN